MKSYIGYCISKTLDHCFCEVLHRILRIAKAISHYLCEVLNRILTVAKTIVTISVKDYIGY